MSARAALLSNFEVLSLLRELENDHIEQTRAARAKKEEDPKAQSAGGATGIEVSENLRTIEVEVRSHILYHLGSVLTEPGHPIPLRKLLAHRIPDFS